MTYSHIVGINLQIKVLRLLPVGLVKSDEVEAHWKAHVTITETFVNFVYGPTYI